MKQVWRWFLQALGLLAVLLGVAGIFLPGLPATPFLLLAAWLFARANPAWEARLLAHPSLGPSIRAWRERREIPPRARALALLMLFSSALAGIWLLPMPWSLLQAAFLLLVALWIGTRRGRR